MNTEEFYGCIDKTLEMKPTLTLDDGADLIFSVHNRHPDLIETIIGGTEETTTGVHRLRTTARDEALRYPVIAVNDAETKWDFDNVFGTGQCRLEGILSGCATTTPGAVAPAVPVPGYPARRRVRAGVRSPARWPAPRRRSNRPRPPGRCTPSGPGRACRSTTERRGWSS